MYHSCCLDKTSKRKSIEKGYNETPLILSDILQNWNIQWPKLNLYLIKKKKGKNQVMRAQQLYPTEKWVGRVQRIHFRNLKEVEYSLCICCSAIVLTKRKWFLLLPRMSIWFYFRVGVILFSLRIISYNLRVT